MTDELVARWQESGRQAMQDLAKGDDCVVASAVLQELVRAGLDRRVDAMEVGATVKDIIAQQDEGSDIESLFLDTISLLDDADAKNSALTRLVNSYRSRYHATGA
jgi:THO complex subunit 2